ncbi:MAG: hypothetical protein ABIR91_05355 [Candidatus Saccharimonadales bacterium]
MNEAGAKQQIVDKIKNNSNILVTVSTDPSVDELSAALGLTVLLNKMGKHATAVFSGQIPAAMQFLDPEKTFENTVDSLRDFIIALDKEKADHLRYKVDGDVVKIFITPYRTTITSDDLDFTQGDYNVELVLALGVMQRDNLDTALTAHGRILHDATVATMSVGGMKSELGSINWREERASSLSEMLVSVIELLSGDKAELDEQIATALLTGIVAATDRFSNRKTSSKVMTIAAQLMAAGANQQLIASKLEAAQEITGPEVTQSSDQSQDQPNRDGLTDLAEGQSTKLDHTQSQSRRSKRKPKKDDGSLTIAHHQPDPTPPSMNDSDQVSQPEYASVTTGVATGMDAADDSGHQYQEPDVADQLSPESPQPAIRPDALDKTTETVTQQRQVEAAEYAEQNLEKQLLTTLPKPATPTMSVEDLQNDIAQASAGVDQAAQQVYEQHEPAAPAPFESLPSVPAPQPESAPPQPAYEPLPAPQQAPLTASSGTESWRDNDGPSVGGTLNATAEQAADDKRREERQSRNRTILSHTNTEYVGNQAPLTSQSPINSSSMPSDEPAIADPFAQLQPPVEDSAPTSRGAPLQPLSSEPTLADLDQHHRAPLTADDDARAAVEQALGMPPATSDLQQHSPYEPSQPSFESTSSFDAPPLPPLPDFNTLPPLPPLPDMNAPQSDPSLIVEPERLEDMFAPAPAAATAPQPTDPGQFQIPGQQ